MQYLEVLLSAAILTAGIIYAVSMHRRFTRLERQVDALQKLGRDDPDQRESRS